MSTLNSHQRKLLELLQAGDSITWREAGTADRVRAGVFCHVARGGHLVVRHPWKIGEDHMKVAPRALLQAARRVWTGPQPAPEVLAAGHTVHRARPSRWVPLELLPTPAKTG